MFLYDRRGPAGGRFLWDDTTDGPTFLDLETLLGSPPGKGIAEPPVNL